MANFQIVVRLNNKPLDVLEIPIDVEDITRAALSIGGGEVGAAAVPVNVGIITLNLSARLVSDARYLDAPKKNGLKLVESKPVKEEEKVKDAFSIV